MDVSIIIPTYNRLWSLPRAVDSCRNTICKTEIIVVDDGSTDGTSDWLKQQQDIVVVSQNNQGQTYAINNGVKLAKGKYMRFLDSDDFLNPEVIDLQFNKAENEAADLVYSGVGSYLEESKVKIPPPEIAPWGDFLEVQLSNRYGSHFLGMLFKTDMVHKAPRRPEFALREDRAFLLEYGLLNPKIAFVNVCAGYWTKHSTQMQGNYSGLKAQVANWQQLTLFKKILSALESSGELTDARKKAACTVLWPLAHWIAIHHLTEAVEVVKWIHQLDPNFQPPEQGMLGKLYKKLGFKNAEKILKLRRSVVNIFR
ncbi:glycosyltransferase family 2 protein [Mucilaginibacter auburnensis]|uniref:Glycosyl transferase family 2 n=1 Tax=Mucilaginibacter auburnensis TaxID=1457233 RepID=A0A2H9VMB9_9SPHI|nr:glycosyltransferase family 2 protein [Mucilaginibacter auburnensis]PJJ79455.1 glycosyl transferase family 2 [Mucilaginibacter auburnensis]